MSGTSSAAIARRYGFILTATFAIVLLLSAGLVAVEYAREEAAERDRIALRLSERLVELTALVAATVDAVDALRSRAEALASDPGAAPPRSALAPAPGDLLTLDDPPPGIDRRGHGNVMARAALPAPEFQRETRIALGLGPTFTADAQAAPFIAWQSFVSAGGTVAVFPWISSRLFPLEPDPRGRALFARGTPEENPGRHRFWIGIEDDPAGKGAVVGAGAPVYDGDRFVGTVAALIPLEALGEIAAQLRYPLGRLVLLDPDDRVLAMAGAVDRGDPGRAAALDALAPEARRPGITRTIAAAARRLEAADGHLVFAAELDQAPWRLVYLVPRLDLAASIAARSGVAVVAPLLGLVVLLLVAHMATRREFVVPATRLVGHIDAASRQPDAAIPAVPAAWRPFFAAVSDSFAAHGQLVSIRQELDVARRMQQAILPSAFPPHAAVDLAARMIPALEVGGDFYDFFWLDRTRLGLVIADVSDKGVGAALFMAVSRTLLRAVAPGAAGPAACLGAASNILAEDNPASMFVTVFYGVLDVETGELVYASGGHPPPLVVSTSGEVAPLPRTRGAALGMFPDQRFEERQAALPAGASLFLYTDGVTEATAPDGSEFGSARLAAALAAQPPDAMLAALLGAVEGFVAGRPRADDVTCMVVRRRSHAAA